MTEVQSFIRLQTWLSPAFPTGAFSYSHGLEQAIANDLVKDQQTLYQWLGELINHGAGWNDAVLFAETWRLSCMDESLKEVTELAIAMSISKERDLETTAQGSAFLKAASAWCDVSKLSEKCPLPVAVGAITAKQNIDLILSLTGYLHAYISNQIQAALRLMKLGQQGGVEILAELEEEILKTAKVASQTSLDDLGSCAFMADICAMQHEILETRIFRS